MFLVNSTFVGIERVNRAIYGIWTKEHGDSDLYNEGLLTLAVGAFILMSRLVSLSVLLSSRGQYTTEMSA